LAGAEKETTPVYVPAVIAVVVPTVKVYATEPSVLVTEVADAPSVIALPKPAVTSDLIIDDKSMRSWMEKVEERLNILTPNPELEKEWDQLRRLGERYRKLEKKCQEKSDAWNKLKNMPKPEIKL
jgi:hypothetical protein